MPRSPIPRTKTPVPDPCEPRELWNPIPPGGFEVWSDVVDFCPPPSNTSCVLGIWILAEGILGSDV